MRKNFEEKYCNCGRKIDTRAIDLLDYTSHSEVFSLVVGEMPPCKQKSCKKIGAPNRYGFCEDYSRDKVPGAIFALQFIVGYSRNENKKERRSLFYRVMIILESYKLTSHHTIEDAVEKLKYHI